MDYKQRNIIDELLVLALEGRAGDEQIHMLNQYISSDSEVEQYCVDFLSLAGCLRNVDKFAKFFLERESEYVEDSALCQIIEENWEVNRIEEISKSRKQRQQNMANEVLGKHSHTTQVVRSELSLISIFRICGAIAALVAVAVLLNMLAGIVETRFYEIKVQVASLTSQVDTVWEYESESVRQVARLRQGNWKLVQGRAEITFDDGAVVTLEAPVEFKLKNGREMILDHGRIFAYVPKEAIGFSVDMPMGKVVDLGTKFGVEVQADGSSELHVFKGKTSLFVDNDNDIEDGVILNAGRAMRVDGVSGKAIDIEINRTAFMRKFDIASDFVWRGGNLDLADIIGGGDGFGSGREGISIDSMTGEIAQYMDFTEPKDRSVPSHFSRQLLNTKFTMVKSLPFIDSIVFPYGKAKKGVKISSHGHFYKDGPHASGVLHQHISNYNPGPLSDGKMHLNGKIYGLDNLPMIYIHATSGITFDMEVIRKAMPDIEITRFKCLMGFDENQKNVIAEDRVVKYNFVVLIDGNKVLDESKIRPGPNLVSVDIPIGNAQRFLTIFVNDGGDGTANDRCVIAEPILELRAKQGGNDVAG